MDKGELMKLQSSVMFCIFKKSSSNPGHLAIKGTPGGNMLSLYFRDNESVFAVTQI